MNESWAATSPPSGMAMVGQPGGGPIKHLSGLGTRCLRPGLRTPLLNGGGPGGALSPGGSPVWGPYGGEPLLAVGGGGTAPSPPVGGIQALPYVFGSSWAMLYGHSPGGGTAALSPCTPEFPGNNFQVLLRRRGAQREAISPPPRWAPREGDALLSPPTARPRGGPKPGLGLREHIHVCAAHCMAAWAHGARVRGAHRGQPTTGGVRCSLHGDSYGGAPALGPRSYGGKIPRAWRVGFTPV